MVNVGKYNIHGCYGTGNLKHRSFFQGKTTTLTSNFGICMLLFGDVFADILTFLAILEDTFWENTGTHISGKKQLVTSWVWPTQGGKSLGKHFWNGDRRTQLEEFYISKFPNFMSEVFKTH